MQELPQHSRGHPISELEDDSIMRVASRMAPNKARGVDVLSPIDIQRLPTEGQQQFGDLQREAERVGSWPVQLLLTVRATAPKPSGGGRVIGVLPTCMGVRSRARAPITDQWSQDL
eukprot:4837156-Pyramimonas_sp.AAC.1